jgi:site-specific DNA-methyltransferase (adenine-specific)
METNKIYLGDCLEVMGAFPNNSIDCIVTDPPYMINYKTGYRKNKNHDFCNVINNDDNFDLIVTIMPEMYRILKDNTAIYMFCNSTYIDKFKVEFEKYFNLKNIVVWVKNNWTAGDLKNAFGKQYEFILYGNKGACNIKSKRYSDIWNFKRIVGSNQLHQNQKPVSLIQRCLYQVATRATLYSILLWVVELPR